MCHFNEILKSSWNCTYRKSSGVPEPNAVFFWISRLTVWAEKVLPDNFQNLHRVGFDNLLCTVFWRKSRVEYKQTVCKASLKIRQNTAVNYQFDVGLLLKALWTYILDHFCNLHTTNAVLAMDLVFVSFFQCHFTLFTKNRQISFTVVSSGFIFQLKIEKKTPIKISSQVSI